MSRHGYDYSFTPSRRTGWRSAFRNVLIVSTVAAASAISGGVVALDLLGSGSDRAAVVTPPVSLHVARAVTPNPSQPASGPAAQPVSKPTNADAAAEKPQAIAATATVAPVQPSITSAPHPAPPQPAPMAQAAQAPAAPVAPVAPPKAAEVAALASARVSAPVPESELTFTKGYARRRAVQEAATASSRQKTDVARLESKNQFGRPATKTKPKTTLARQNAPQDQRRVAEARAEGGVFSRFDQPDRADFARHQALAFGDPRDSRATRRPPPQQQGGSFGNSLGGFFRGLF